MLGHDRRAAPFIAGRGEIEPGLTGTVSRASVLLPTTRPGTPALNFRGDMVVVLEFDEAQLAGVFVARREDSGVLSLTRVTQGLVISWSGEGVTLEQAENVAKPWEASTNQTNPQFISPTTGQAYFRLAG